MQIEFGQDYLRELYFYGSAKSKKYRFQPEIIRRYISVVDRLRSITDLQMLYGLKGLHYEKKTGNLGNIEAVWINDQFRLEFISRLEINGQMAITICTLLRISNHYQN